MRLIARLSWVLLLPLLLVGGCQEVGGASMNVEVVVTVADGFDEVPLKAAKVCQTGTSNCVTTDASGDAILELPADQELSYTVEKKEYGPLLYPVVTGSQPANPDANMEPNEWLAQQFGNLNSAYPPTETGHIRVIFAPKLAGATVRLVDATGKRYYADEEANWSADLTATTEGEGCCSAGGFVGVVPGTFQVEIGGTTQDCLLSTSSGLRRGWPGNEPNTIRVPVQEGFETRTVLRCPLPR